MSTDQVESHFDYASELTLWKKRIEEGNAAYSDRRYSKAEIRFSEALKQAESWPKDSPIEQRQELDSCLSKSLNNLAALYHSQGKHALAEDLYLQSLEIKKRLLGEENAEVALNLQNLAACYCAKRKYAEAEELFKRSLEIREKIVGPNHPDLITTLKNYAILLRRLDREEDAKVLETRSARLEEFKT
jgi:tetratricopeptide (TPR) repeat protein